MLWEVMKNSGDDNLRDGMLLEKSHYENRFKFKVIWAWIVPLISLNEFGVYVRFPFGKGRRFQVFATDAE